MSSMRLSPICLILASSHALIPSSPLSKTLYNCHRCFRAPSAPSARVRMSTVVVNPLEYSFGLQDPGFSLPHGIKEGDAPQPFTITQEQIDALECDGAVCIPGFLSDEWLDYLRRTTEWQIDHPHSWASPGVISGIYDYIQRNVWTTNAAFAKFMYYSPLGPALAKLRNAKTLRLTTDLLMVNPNKGFKWHQDNQNGPVDFPDALRWWVTMDDTPADHGAPVYLRGSHNNKAVDGNAVFVELTDGDLPKYNELLEFRPRAGDLIVWHARSIHKIDGPKSQDWGSTKRRVLGGTVAVDDCRYFGEKKAMFSDLGTHDMKEGDALNGPHWPLIYPRLDPEENAARERGEVTRTTEGVLRLMGNMAHSIGEMASWTNVLNKKDDISARK